MKYQKLLFLILISFTFEFRSYEFIRKLQAEVGTDVINTELEPETSEFETIEPTTTPETTIPYVIPDHQEDTTVPVVEPGGPGIPDQPTTGQEEIVHFHHTMKQKLKPQAHLQQQQRQILMYSLSQAMKMIL